MAKKILIVDDQENVARALQAGLSVSGYDADIALGGQQGFQDTVFDAYDAAFLDLHMPEINGVELIRALKLVNNEIKIIILSGFVDDFDKELQELRVDAVLSKPYDLNEVRALLAKLLG